MPWLSILFFFPICGISIPYRNCTVLYCPGYSTSSLTLCFLPGKSMENGSSHWTPVPKWEIGKRLLISSFRSTQSVHYGFSENVPMYGAPSLSLLSLSLSFSICLHFPLYTHISNKSKRSLTNKQIQFCGWTILLQ